MTLSDLKLNDHNCFVAMQYYWLIMNRTYLVILADDSLLGLVANGLVSVKGRDWLTQSIVSKLTIQGDLNNPLSYVKYKRMQKVSNLDLGGDEILAQNKANFRIRYSDITSVRYDPKKKWGMGYYPHDGKVYVETNDGRSVEFIILGNQSGELVKDIILSRK